MKNGFSSSLKQLRTERNLFQKDVANLLNITDRQYQRYEYGKQEPNIDKLIKLADYFGVSLDDLVGHEDPSKETSNVEKKLLKSFRNLSNDGKNKLLNYLDDLISSGKY